MSGHYSTKWNCRKEKMSSSWGSKVSHVSHNIPNYFWREAILTTTFLINCLPSCVLSFKFLQDVFLQFHPQIQNLFSTLPLCVFGCSAFVHNHSHRSKLDPKSSKCIFLGYASHGCHILWISSGTNVFHQPVGKWIPPWMSHSLNINLSSQSPKFRGRIWEKLRHWKWNLSPSFQLFPITTEVSSPTTNELVTHEFNHHIPEASWNQTPIAYRRRREVASQDQEC